MPLQSIAPKFISLNDKIFISPMGLIGPMRPIGLIGPMPFYFGIYLGIKKNSGMAGAMRYTLPGRSLGAIRTCIEEFGARPGPPETFFALFPIKGPPSFPLRSRFRFQLSHHDSFHFFPDIHHKTVIAST